MHPQNNIYRPCGILGFSLIIVHLILIYPVETKNPAIFLAMEAIKVYQNVYFQKPRHIYLNNMRGKDKF